MKIDDRTGIWLNDNLDGHGYDSHLSDSIVTLLNECNIKSIYDFGCGHGLYTKSFLDNNIYAVGFDGNPNTNALTDGICNVLDLSKEFMIDKLECVMCLEVGEHIPKEYEQVLISNIHNHNTKKIILSWAIEGQGGDGHINCRNNDYIKNIFLNLGYDNNLEQEEKLRRDSTFSWFKNTIMVFDRNNME